MSFTLSIVFVSPHTYSLSLLLSYWLASLLFDKSSRPLSGSSAVWVAVLLIFLHCKKQKFHSLIVIRPRAVSDKDRCPSFSSNNILFFFLFSSENGLYHTSHPLPYPSSSWLLHVIETHGTWKRQRQVRSDSYRPDFACFGYTFKLEYTEMIN